MSDPNTRTYAEGDRVIVDPSVAQSRYLGVVYVVKEILKVNVVVEPQDGGRRLRIKPAYLLPAPTDAADAVTIAVESLLGWGTVVRVDRAPAGAWRHPVDALYVVVGDKDRGLSYRLARLGGDPSGRYFKSIPRGWLTEVPVETINAGGPR